MHNWCQPKVSDGHIQKGCLGKQKHYVMDQNWNSFSLLKGIPRYKYTLSSIGGPCHFDYTLHSSLDSHFSCAICVPNCHQCGPYTKVPLKKFSNGQYCTKGEAVRRCYGKSRLSHDLQLKSP